MPDNVFIGTDSKGGGDWNDPKSWSLNKVPGKSEVGNLRVWRLAWKGLKIPGKIYYPVEDIDDALFLLHAFRAAGGPAIHMMAGLEEFGEKGWKEWGAEITVETFREIGYPIWKQVLTTPYTYGENIFRSWYDLKKMIEAWRENIDDPLKKNGLSYDPGPTMEEKVGAMRAFAAVTNTMFFMGRERNFE